MSYTVQVTFDCADPHGLAEWWAETLGWQVEAQDAAFIRQMVEAGHASEDETTVHRGSLVWRTGAPIVDPEGAAPRILFQQVPEGKSGKNRVHLDVRAAPGLSGDERMAALETECHRLVALGASRLRREEPAPPMSDGFIVMADPEGNEFCLD